MSRAWLKKKAVTLSENAQRLITAVNDAVSMLVASGVSEVDIEQIVNQVKSVGFNVNRESILAVLNDSPFVDSVQGGVVKVGGKAKEPELVGVDSEERVSQMAAGSI